MKPSAPSRITGTISTTRKGLGFITNPNDIENDILIEAGNLNTALNGDTVEVVVHAAHKEPRHPSLKKHEFTAEVIQVISRARESFVGTVDIEQGLCFVTPDDKKMYTDIIIPPDFAKDLKKDQKVQVRISSWKDPKKNPQGEILRVLGDKGNNDVEMESIVLDKGFDTRFPEAVEKDAEEIEQHEKIITAEEIAKRRDFRQTLTFTIDPFDAKDFDDAISFKKLPDENGQARYEIGVHIADVSHYVREGTALDKEAVKRGCSIYLVDRTIPMLPEILSNDVCSLNPHTDKLSFSAVFILDDKAVIHERWFGRTIMNSAFRFTYETAQSVIDGAPEALGEFIHEHANVSDPVKGMIYRNELVTLNTLAKILQKEKFKKGAIEFETEEIKFKLDENGKPIGVYKKERIDTHKLVEEYMLLANKEVSKFIYDSMQKKGKKDTGSIYRIHDVPDKDRITDLATFVKALGYELKSHDGLVTAHDMNKLLAQVKDTPHESLVRTAAVRSMQKAIYSTRNIGHFGLAFEFYTHFTSPIRRYPDLLVHRILAKHLAHLPFQDNEISAFQTIAESSTRQEISASEAERASKKLKQVEYMSERVGQTFDGTISGVTEFGIYVEEKETKSEGMINIRNLGDDFYEFNQKTYSIAGKRSKQKFTLGDPIRFKVMAADFDRKILDYGLVK